ncbi:MAG: 3-hydroxyacyl-CoA dehydrogenase NAD-binding domain-containing protein, partial [Candidatus Latescibacteria bacterium]|nr:3-hydroxyacyl-CoA dehydrogenase NAD-binding domain-containing protein [Candidatus Latescibacterota bacterium]
MQPFSPRKIAVLGAGVMGTQIACDLGDKGYSVHLYDMPGLAEKQLAAAVGNDLCSSTGVRRVVPVDSTGENHPLLGEADWIVEAVFEEESAKEEINAIIGAHRNPEGVVTTNTSGLGINAMARSQSADFRAGYALSHFFNPVKALGLLEVCPVEGTDPDLYDAFCHFASHTIGKTVVHVRDTPNFVGNRIGGFALFLPFRLDTAELSVLDIDRICLCTVGWEPLKTWDIVGLPLAGPLGGNVYDRAPDDPRHEWWNPKVPEIETLIGQELVGRKGRTRSGFLGMVEGQKTMYDFGGGEYVPARLSDFPSLRVAMDREAPSRQKIGALLSSEVDDAAARFARGFFYSALAYGLQMVGEICDDIADIDTALKHGYNWPAGLFERAQQVGLETCLQGMEAAGCGDMVPDWYRGIVAGGGQLYDVPAGTFYSWAGNRMDSLPTVAGGIYPEVLRKSTDNVLFANDDAAVIDMSDDTGPVCLVEITARALGHGPIEAGHRALDWAEQQQAAVVFGSTGPHFGFGADLHLFHQCSEDGDAQTISNLIRAGQELMQRLEYSSCPTVAAIQGLCLGGSSEWALACNRRVAN